MGALASRYVAKGHYEHPYVPAFTYTYRFCQRAPCRGCPVIFALSLPLYPQSYQRKTASHMFKRKELSGFMTE